MASIHLTTKVQFSDNCQNYYFQKSVLQLKIPRRINDEEN
jgi:hypothetical protein